MHCENIVSFRLYLRRVHERLSLWINCIVELVIQLEGQIAQKRRQNERFPQKKNAQEWQWFLLLVRNYHLLYCRLPAAPLITDRFVWQYIYALFSRRRMGLGP